MEAMPYLASTRTESESNIGICTADFGLTGAARGNALGPAYFRAVQWGFDTDSVARKWVAEDVGKIIPDILAIQGIGKVGLGASVVKSILNGSELDGNASRSRVMVEDLGISATWFDRFRRANGASDWPEVDGEATFVDNFGIPNGTSKRRHGGDSCNNGNSREVHFENRDCSFRYNTRLIGMWIGLENKLIDCKVVNNDPYIDLPHLKSG